MSNEACRALREIQLGRLQIADFAPPEVFTSGFYEVYSLTLADLRWHLGECDACASCTNEARVQLEAVDRGRFEAINEALDAWQEAIASRFRTAEFLSDGLARDIVDITDEYVNHVQDDEDGAFGDFRRRILEETRERVYLAAIKVHAFFGQTIARWLETLLPPALPRVFHVGAGGKTVDVRIHCDRFRIQLSAAPDFLGVLAGNDQVARVLLRCLLLWEAFGSLGPDLADEAAVAKLLGDCATPDWPGERKRDIAWQRVWEHYSDLADMTVERLWKTAGSIVPGESAISAQLETITKKLHAIDEKSQGLLDAQTAMMDSLERQEAVHRELLEAYRKLPSAIQDRCRDTVELALGDLFGQLADKSRACLLTGEWIYSESPPNLEFSGAIVEFTKAFEEQVRRSMASLDERLQELIASDHNWKGPRRTSRLQLGHWVHLLEDHKPELESEMARLGLDYQLFADAIKQVNEYKGAKHTEVKSKADATSLHSLFLGRPSVLAAVVRKAN
jgi:hypothetical protein